MSLLTSVTTAALDAALAKAQGEILSALKDKTNPAFRSKYADLAAVWEACRPALSKHGVAVTQWPIHSDDARLHLVTRLAHAGEWLCAEMSVPVAKADAHGTGSAITYAKRFALAAAVGVVADEDDDGNAASGKATPDAKGDAKPFGDPPRKAAADVAKEVFPEATVVGDYITEAQVGRLQTIARKAGHKNPAVKTWLAHTYGVASSKALRLADYDAVCARLEQPEAL